MWIQKLKLVDLEVIYLVVERLPFTLGWKYLLIDIDHACLIIAFICCIIYIDVIYYICSI